MKLKVMTFNIAAGFNYENPMRRDYDFACQVIKQANPDIVGLQEIGLHPTRGFPQLNLECSPTDYLSTKTNLYGFFGKAIDYLGFPYGNSILSKHTFKKIENIPIPNPVEKNGTEYYESRSIIKAEIDVCGILTVFVSHFGLNADEQMLAVETLVNEISKVKGPIILMGDFNVSPDNEILKPLNDLLIDTACVNPAITTFPSDIQENGYSGYLNIKQRKIDYIFVSKNIKINKLYNIDTLASDHLPLIAEIDIDEKTNKTKYGIESMKN